MKIEYLLSQHLYNDKQVTLQGIGTFTLSPDVVFPADTDKDVVIPPDGLTFTYNNRAEEDPALISYIVQQTRKIRPLASADLDSYLALGKQFLNIGKPFLIEGLGTLVKNQQGAYEFVPGNFISQKTEAAPAQLKEKREDERISFGTPQGPVKNKKALLIVGSILILGLGAWAGLYFLNKKRTDSNTAAAEKKEAESTTDKRDSNTATPPVTQKPDSPAVQNTAPVKTDGYTFKVVFKETTDKAAAIKKMNELTNRKHTVLMYTRDSVTFYLAEPYNLPLADTARVMDSLKRFYYPGSRMLIELH